ncbi:MAG: PilZ domain-containing protein [Candidatus Sulfotelmatobacter sp.]
MASKHHGATQDYWSFVIAVVTEVTGLRAVELSDRAWQTTAVGMTAVTCRKNWSDPRMHEGMTLSSLLVCADKASVEVLRQVLEELGIHVELCTDNVRAAVRLAQERYDLIILDCETQAGVVALLHESRSSRLNDATLTVVVVAGQESIREMFSLGVNFVLYKPVSHERVLSTLRAAQTVLYRDKRRKARAAVHTHATIDYAGEERAKATLVNLAEDGMGVNFGKKLPPTCKVYFQFQLPGQMKNVRLSGQVVWQDWNGRAGIQFMDVPQASRRVLQEWLKVNVAEAPKQEPSAEAAETSVRPDEDSAAAEQQVERQEAQGRDGEAGARLRAKPDNRRQTRYACRLGAEVYQRGSSVRNYCHLSDLSPGGCYLEMPLAFPAGTLIEVTVRTQDMKLRLSGVVKASHPGYGMGISFKLNTKDERHGVQQLIDFAATMTESS